MDTNKMREEFLCWVSKRKLVTRNKASLRMNSDESQFLDYRVNDLWCAWQASREAVVVELPEPDLPEAYLDEPVDRESEEFRYLEARHGAQCQTYRKCRQAIEAQGLKVKP